MKTGIKSARTLFPATKKVKYFFNGGICLIPTPVQTALSEFTDQNRSGFSDKNWGVWSENVSAAYRLFAGLIGASQSEVVGIPNTSTGTGVFALMIDPKKGSNVVYDDLTYNTVFPFSLRAKTGVEQRIIRNDRGSIDVGQFEKAVDDKTSAVVVSSVSCWNGYRYDLGQLSEIAHAHGAYLVVDAAQHVGAIGLDVKKDGVDFLATCGHKWLLGPPGTGFMYVRGDLISKFDPPLPGWMGIDDPGGYEMWKPTFPRTALRYETGMPSMMLLGGMRASLELINKLEPASIEREVLRRSGYLIEKLSDTGVDVFTPTEKEHRAGLVTFLLKNHQQLFAELSKNSFVVFHHPETVVKNMHWTNGGFRIDPTFFNTFEEIDDLVDHVRKWSRR